VPISTDGVTTLTYFATDNAGNEESAKIVTIRIDQTPPTLTCTVTPNILWPPNGKMATVTASVTVADDVSGPSGFVLTAVTSNEPGSGQINGFTIGTPSTRGQLQAARLGPGTGRIYTLTYTGTDQAGNSATCNATVTVPHDQGR
jgi:hypothetical protein